MKEEGEFKHHFLLVRFPYNSTHSLYMQQLPPHEESNHLCIINVWGCKEILLFSIQFNRSFCLNKFKITKTSSKKIKAFGNSLPWSQRFFLIFLRERDQQQAVKRRQRVTKATRRERKTSGYLGLESHFHADDSCQTRQIANKKSDQWQLSKHVLISRYFFKWG